uniref:helix-turn-helix transcriptional regulator n=1 Tax=Streptomyces shenzhenensis TaxID=943815 RepID=UPI0015F0A304
RHRVTTLQAATTPLTSGDGASIAPETLTVMASAVAGQERLRFAYRAADGSETRRQTEPYRLVSTGLRWYLVAYDIDRDDWRTFRVDRVSEPFATGARFAPREMPTGSAAEYLRRSIQRQQETYGFAVAFAGTAEEVRARLPGWLGTPVDEEGGWCVVRGESGDPVEWLAVRLVMAGCEFVVREPSELVACVRELGGRLSRAGGA